MLYIPFFNSVSCNLVTNIKIYLSHFLYFLQICYLFFYLIYFLLFLCIHIFSLRFHLLLLWFKLNFHILNLNFHFLLLNPYLGLYLLLLDLKFRLHSILIDNKPRIQLSFLVNFNWLLRICEIFNEFFSFFLLLNPMLHRVYLVYKSRYILSRVSLLLLKLIIFRTSN